MVRMCLAITKDYFLEKKTFVSQIKKRSVYCLVVNDALLYKKSFCLDGIQPSKFYATVMQWIKH